ncbi:NAD(P)/FAD-dependent oxidoreductase [Pseudonocardia sp. RS11V-5]|uniref:NAD(P)/FAD-dependent oxidoreductase n=1 Tax=Pseudonocardia terrae TaxID=2905831 RepID=UPI001E57B05E|nr:NAD(P)/FAD-dependent oxidoreductase [Pseudonocardia terrae]MCE3556049.1 NAD(P)/FAD-dependent oxidoreductase [Pseudonocardia terrae]
MYVHDSAPERSTSAGSVVRMRAKDSGRPQVVVIGGGFGGVRAAKALARADVDVTLVDRTNHHLFQPLLYQVATGILAPGLIAPALRRVVKKERNVRTLLAEVHDIDPERKVVRAATPAGQTLELPYDYLVVAGGATHAYFGHPQWSQFAPGMKTVDDARMLRSHILGAYELAELATDDAERRARLTFVVVGAGPTGVEITGQLAELARYVLPEDYRSIDTRRARIILLDAGPAVLGPFAPKLQAYTRRRLEEMGVEVRVNTAATDMDDESITVKGPAGEERIVARTKIWAAGVQASPLAAMLAEATGAPTDRAGRVAVRADCSLPGAEGVYAIGDMVTTPDRLPGVAQVAMQQGTYVGRQIADQVKGHTGTPAPFRYVDKGSMATIGARQAVADVRGVTITGYLAYLLWCYVHVMFLVGWGNRLGTLYNWVRSLHHSRNRGHRLISMTGAPAAEEMQAAA